MQHIHAWRLNSILLCYYSGCTCLQEAVQQYSAVFSWLLCLKRVSLLMRNMWLDLVSCARWSHQAPAQGSEAADAERHRLRILQLFRHEAAHLVAALQAYMQGQMLGACWHRLQSIIMVSCPGDEAPYKLLESGPMPFSCPYAFVFLQVGRTSATASNS